MKAMLCKVMIVYDIGIVYIERRWINGINVYQPIPGAFPSTMSSPACFQEFDDALLVLTGSSPMGFLAQENGDGTHNNGGLPSGKLT